MDKSELITKVKAGNYSQEKLLGWISALPSSTQNRKPSYQKVGDVYMSAVFLHPYILLQKKKDLWICALLTSDETFPDILEPCESRFFEGKFIVKSLFTATEIRGSFVNSYENIKHLREVLKKLKTIMK